jgi:hypothetical protein
MANTCIARMGLMELEGEGVVMARPRKNAKRTKAGRISRAKVNFDKGTEHAQAMQVLYGPDGCDAIGRAFRSGLLGAAEDGKPLLDIARKVSRSYWRAYATGAVRSCIGGRTFGAVVDIDHERVKREEIWLNESLRIVDRMGRNVRRSFDQLVIDVNPDNGPQWLDALIYDRKDSASTKKIQEAMDALEAISG